MWMTPMGICPVRGCTVHDVTLEFPGQIIKLSAYDKSSSLGVTLTKRGNAEVLAGNQMRYPDALTTPMEERK